ncbi:MAG: hypothetical protein KJP04_01525 [Arenicella sp.]|nr:hypothetical protein [Arenicella sp.]
MPKSIIYPAIPVFLVTSVVWIYGVSNHLFLAKEIPQYIAIFVVPGAFICCACWLMFARPVWWRRIAGVAILLPSLVVWIISLILVFNGFKIH